LTEPLDNKFPKGFPEKCPYCKSEDIEGYDHDYSLDGIDIKFRCNKCEERFLACGTISDWYIEKE